MGKGNNRCSRAIGRVLAESLLGAVKSKANPDVTVRLDCHWPLPTSTGNVSFQPPTASVLLEKRQRPLSPQNPSSSAL